MQEKHLQELERGKKELDKLAIVGALGHWGVGALQNSRNRKEFLGNMEVENGIIQSIDKSVKRSLPGFSV